MQTGEGLCPAHDFVGGRLGSVEGGMLVWLHGLLLSYGVSEGCIRMYRVSHMKEKIMKLFHGSEDNYCSAYKCNCSGPGDALSIPQRSKEHQALLCERDGSVIHSLLADQSCQAEKCPGGALLVPYLSKERKALLCQ